MQFIPLYPGDSTVAKAAIRFIIGLLLVLLPDVHQFPFPFKPMVEKTRAYSAATSMKIFGNTGQKMLTLCNYGRFFLNNQHQNGAKWLFLTYFFNYRFFHMMGNHILLS